MGLGTDIQVGVSLPSSVLTAVGLNKAEPQHLQQCLSQGLSHTHIPERDCPRPSSAPQCLGEPVSLHGFCTGRSCSRTEVFKLRRHEDIMENEHWFLDTQGSCCKVLRIKPGLIFL